MTTPWELEVDWTTGNRIPRARSRSKPSWHPPAPPGVLPKRPLRFFEVLDVGFRLLRFSPGMTVGASLIVFTVWTLCLGLAVGGVLAGTFRMLESVFADADAAAGFGFLAQLGILATAVLSLALLPLLAGLSSVAAEAAFASRRMSLAAGWRSLRGVRWRLLGLVGVVAAAHLVLLLVCAAVPVLLVLLGAGLAAGLTTLLAVLVWAVAAAYLSITTSFAGCVTAGERVGVFAALRRSWSLTRRRFWPVTGQLLLGYFLSNQLVSIIITPLVMVFYVVLLLVALVGMGGQTTGSILALLVGGVALLLMTFLVLVSTGVLFAYLAGLVAGAYLDARIRLEGYDLVLLARAEGREPSSPAEAGPGPASSAGTSSSPVPVGSRPGGAR